MIKKRLEDRGIAVIEEDMLHSSLGFCKIGINKPVIHITKNLDEMNKISVLFHEAIHASGYWTKRRWWMHYCMSGTTTYLYMEEALALKKQLELSSVFELNDTYSVNLATKLLKSTNKKLGAVNKIKIESEIDRVDEWLLNTFKGIDNAFDKHLYKTTFISSRNNYRDFFY